MSDRERSSPTLIETGLKNLIGGRDGNYPLISGINGKFQIIGQLMNLYLNDTDF
ncbi:GH17268 [Drosophila grimshawi]|uniref:GH17268 n=1 Tax=Drosophila grimshawi TaxID=7222 RepID=B4J117_DROGR|nr:GH17268 [Drosophila grimshawi]